MSRMRNLFTVFTTGWMVMLLAVLAFVAPPKMVTTLATQMQSTVVQSYYMEHLAWNESGIVLGAIAASGLVISLTRCWLP